MIIHMTFHKARNFPHPNQYAMMGKKPGTSLFHPYPEAKPDITHWCRQHISTLSSESVDQFIRTTIIPKCYKSHTEEFSKNYTTPLTLTQFV